jgi:hypothetical protein
VGKGDERREKWRGIMSRVERGGTRGDGRSGDKGKQRREKQWRNRSKIEEREDEREVIRDVVDNV